MSRKQYRALKQVKAYRKLQAEFDKATDGKTINRLAFMMRQIRLNFGS